MIWIVHGVWVRAGLTRDRNFAGVVLAADEGKNIAQALGNKRAALLGNHGLLTVGKSIEETVAMFVLLDKCCEVQLLADASAAGSGKPLVRIGDEEARVTWEAIGTSESGYCECGMRFWGGLLMARSSRIAAFSDRGARVGGENFYGEGC